MSSRYQVNVSSVRCPSKYKLYVLHTRVVNQKNKNHENGFGKRWKFTKNKGWGWGTFIVRKRLIDASNGFIKNGKVIIQASLDVHVSQATHNNT